MDINQVHTPSETRRKVLFIITQSEFGGAQHFLFNFLSRLDRKHIDPSVAIGSDGDGEFIKAIQSLEIPYHILPHLRRDNNPFSDLAGVQQIRSLLKKVKPDTLFLNSSKAGFIGSLAAQLTSGDIKVVYRIGGWTFNDPWPVWKKNLWIFLERLSAPWKDIIIVNNQHDFDQALQLKISPRKELKLVHNGIDPYYEFLPREQARAQLFEWVEDTSGLSINAPYVVGTIANFYPAKSLVTFINAAAQVSRDDAIFCIIGDGSQRAELEALIKQKKLTQKVFLLGKVPQAAQYLTGFDIFVLGSNKEGFPWSVLEAMVAKTPVIATRVGSIPEMIEDGKNGYSVKIADSMAIAQHIDTLLSNEFARKELGIQGHQTVLFKFSLDTMVRQFESVL